MHKRGGRMGEMGSLFLLDSRQIKKCSGKQICHKELKEEQKIFTFEKKSQKKRKRPSIMLPVAVVVGMT